MNSRETARKVLQTERAALQRAEDRLDENFDRAVELILAAVNNKARILVTGMGKSYHIGQKIAATLTSTGIPATILHPAEAMHGDIGILQSGDLIIALSYSGESDELVTLLPLLRAYSVNIIAITGTPASTLGGAADIILDASVEREACPFNLVPTASTTAALALGDALAIALLEARGLTRNDFARFHPGGSIGRSLLLKVEDIMRSGDALATVGETATVQDALLAMTEAKSGAAIVTDTGNHLLGILSDGDIRRMLAHGQNGFLQRAVADVMTKNPSTVPLGRIAADALAIFRDHHFDDLVVIDDQNCVAGIIDIQDLPKFKIL